MQYTPSTSSMEAIACVLRSSVRLGVGTSRGLSTTLALQRLGFAVRWPRAGFPGGPWKAGHNTPTPHCKGNIATEDGTVSRTAWLCTMAVFCYGSRPNASELQPSPSPKCLFHDARDDVCQRCPLHIRRADKDDHRQDIQPPYPIKKREC